MFQSRNESSPDQTELFASIQTLLRQKFTLMRYKREKLAEYDEEVKDCLLKLNQLSPSACHNLLLTLNNELQSDSFANFLAGLSNEELIRIYLNLLKNLLNGEGKKSISPPEIFKLLKCQDQEGWMLAMHASAETKLLYLDLIDEMCQADACVTQEDVSQLLLTKDINEKTFLSDVAEQFTKTKDPQYLAVMQRLMERGYLTEKSYHLFKKFKNALAAFVLAQVETLHDEDEKFSLLTRASNERDPLGRFFWIQRGSTKPGKTKGNLKLFTNELKRYTVFEEKNKTQEWWMTLFHRATNFRFNLSTKKDKEKEEKPTFHYGDL